LFIGRSGGFEPGCTVAMHVIATRLAAADFDGDGRADVAALDAGTGAVRILRGPGARSCAAAMFSAGAEVSGVAAAAGMTIADLNGDRLPDIVIGVPAITALAVSINTTGA